MQSKTLFFNRTLFRKNLTRFWPLWGMATFGGSLFPLDGILPDPGEKALLFDLCGAVRILCCPYAE